MYKIILAVLFFFVISFILAGCGEDSLMTSTGSVSCEINNVSEALAQIDPRTDWDAIGVIIGQGTRLSAVRSDSLTLPSGLTYEDSLVLDYRNLPVVGSKTTVSYVMTCGETKKIVFPWHEGYMAMGIYNCYLEGGYTTDGSFIFVAGRDPMVGAKPDVYIFKNGTISKLPYPLEMHDTTHFSIPLADIRILNNSVAVQLHPGRGPNYFMGRKSYDVATHETKQAFWVYMYNYFY